MEKRNTLQQRVAKRVEELDASPITLAKSVGLERGYINDIIIGKKKSIRGDKLDAVASALQCDREYLIGLQDTHRLPANQDTMFAGIVETGVWRSADAHEAAIGSLRSVPIEPDSRYAALPNLAFEVRGRGFEAEGIVDGMFVVGVEARAWEQNWPIPAGSVVVVRTKIDAVNAQELSLRLVEPSPEGERLRARPVDADRNFPELSRNDPGVEIVAVVTRAVRLFLGEKAA